MDFDPTDEQRLVIDTVRRFVREEIVPLEADLDPDAERARAGRPRPPRRQGQGDGLLRPRHPRGVRRARHRHRHPHADGDRDVAAPRRPLRAVLRRLRRRRPRPALRGQRGPEGALPLPHPARREARLLRPDRALRRQRPGARDPHHGGARRRRLDPERRARSSSAAPTGRTTGSSSRAPTPRWAGAASPASSSTPTRPGSTSAAWSTPCARATTPPSSQFENVRVPAANVLGEVGGGFAHRHRPRCRRQRIPYAAGCIGVAIKAQEMAIE